MSNTAAAATVTTTTTTTTAAAAAVAARLLRFCPIFNSQDNRTDFLLLFLLESTSPTTRPAGLQARTWILHIPHQCKDMAGCSTHMHRKGCSPPVNSDDQFATVKGIRDKYPTLFKDWRNDYVHIGITDLAEEGNFTTMFGKSSFSSNCIFSQYLCVYLPFYNLSGV